MIQTLDHVIVLVDDLAVRSERFAALLGRAPSWRGAHPDHGTANALFRLDNTYLELLAPDGADGIAPRLRERLDAHGEGVFGLAFGSAEADETVAELRDRGVDVSDPAPGRGRDADTGDERRWRNAYLTPSAGRGLLLFVIEHASPPGRLPLRAPDDPAGAVRALDHVVVQSRDLDAARALYRDGLGLRLALDRTFDARGVRLLFFRVGGTTVEIGGSSTQPAHPGAEDRFGGLAWKVEDADAAHARLVAAGFDVSPVRKGYKPGTRVCTVRDAPASVPTLIIEPAAPGV